MRPLKKDRDGNRVGEGKEGWGGLSGRVWRLAIVAWVWVRDRFELLQGGSGLQQSTSSSC